MALRGITVASLSALLVVIGACDGARSTDTRPVRPSPRAKSNPDWVKPVEPFRVIGNIYYVGTKGLSSFLISGDGAHVLLDGGLPENAALILDSVAQLGFDTADIDLIINSHAHFDHSGGLAALKAATGARLLASVADMPALEGGFTPGSEGDPDYNAPPVDVDATFADGEIVRLGTTSLTARLTPGHTQGCTSWTMTASEGGKSYDVLFFCSGTVAGNRLVGRPQYPGIVEDYRRTLALMQGWRPDVFLSNHPAAFGMAKSRAQQIAGDPLAFVNADAFPAHRAALATAFEKALATQTAQSGGDTR